MCISLLSKMFLGLQFAGFIIPFITSLIIWNCGLKDIFGVFIFLYICIYSINIVGGIEEFYSSWSLFPVSEAFCLSIKQVILLVFLHRCLIR